MKIMYFSDLHLDVNGGFKIPVKQDSKDTVLVLAGDCAEGLYAIKYIDKWAKYFKAIIKVAGNHEFYGHEIDSLIQRWRKHNDRLDNFFFLENETVTIDDVKFIGTTLWSDFLKDDFHSKVISKAMMNDFRRIIWKDNAPKTWGKRKKQMSNSIEWFTPDHAVQLHNKAKNFIIDELAKDRDLKKVVVTHHAPTELGVNTERYSNTELNGAYFSDLEDLMHLGVSAWIFGHTHKTTNARIHGVPVLSNPRGYEKYGDNTNYSFNPVIEV